MNLFKLFLVSKYNNKNKSSLNKISASWSYQYESSFYVVSGIVKNVCISVTNNRLTRVRELSIATALNIWIKCSALRCRTLHVDVGHLEWTRAHVLTAPFKSFVNLFCMFCPYSTTPNIVRMYVQLTCWLLALKLPERKIKVCG